MKDVLNRRLQRMVKILAKKMILTTQNIHAKVVEEFCGKEKPLRLLDTCGTLAASVATHALPPLAETENFFSSIMVL